MDVYEHERKSHIKLQKSRNSTSIFVLHLKVTTSMTISLLVSIIHEIHFLLFPFKHIAFKVQNYSIYMGSM
jgi:hypothetical protein